jgi:ATP-binding cassette subfamily B protein
MSMPDPLAAPRRLLTSLRRVTGDLLIVTRLTAGADLARTIVVLVLRPVNAAGSLLIGLWLKLMLDEVTQGGGDLLLPTIALAVTLGLTLVFRWAGMVIEAALQERVGHAFDQQVSSLVLETPFSTLYDRPEFRDRVSLLREDTGPVCQAVAAVVDVAGAAIAAVIAVALLVSIDPALLFLVLFALPSIVLAAKSDRMRLDVIAQTAEGTRESSVLFQIGTDATAGKDVRVLGLADHLLNRYTTVSADVVRARRTAWATWARWRAVGSALFAVGLAVALARVASGVLDGTYSLGDAFLVVVVGVQLNDLVGTAAFALGTAASALRAVERYRWIEGLTRGHLRPDGRHAAPPAQIGQGIEMRGVCFGYADDEDALHDVSLWLPRGTVTALVGENGAGKTTLLRLLSRLCEPRQGVIMVDDVPLEETDVAAWRGRLSSASQEFARFQLAATQVVGVGDLPRHRDPDAVDAAMTRGGAPDLLAALPSGRETPLGSSFQDGHEPSVGQWQQLALGRAMMREAPLLLLLDEPTASLDPLAEDVMLRRHTEACRQLCASTGAIAVIASHRLSSTVVVDQIVVLDHGHVSEIGGHADLLRSGGLYSELFTLQARSYGDSSDAAT